MNRLPSTILITQKLSAAIRSIEGADAESLSDKFDAIVEKEFPTEAEWGKLESDFDKKLFSARAFIAAVIQKVHEEVQLNLFNGVQQESYAPTIDAFYGLLNDEIHYLIEERSIQNIDNKKYAIIRESILLEIVRRAFDLFSGAAQGNLLTTLWDRVDVHELAEGNDRTSRAAFVGPAKRESHPKRKVAP